MTDLRLVLPPITRTTLVRFAGASSDHNPIHVDVEVARAAGHDDVFSHGMLLMAYLGRLLTGWVPQSAVRSFSVRFVAITPVGAQPTCAATVNGTETVAGETRVILALTAALDDGTVVVRGTATVALA